MSTIFYGALVTPTSLDSYHALPHAILAVSKRTGCIEWLEPDVLPSQLQNTLAKHGLIDTGFELVELKHGEFLLPGFIDTHTHAAQWPSMGSGQENVLLDWLRETVFPTESRFSDPCFARKVYSAVVRRTIDTGTTTCCYYGSLHLEATEILADYVHAAGQRAFVGKCNMDSNDDSDYVEHSSEVSVETTHKLISYIRGLTPNHSTALVQPVLTPRFAISCTPDLLTRLGKLARDDPELTIQTHISENEKEVKRVKELFPPEILPGHHHKHTTYAGVYDAYGLLRENTILAHAVHLEPEEIKLIKARKAGISHCPTSNFNLNSGCAKIGVLLDQGIKVGLGTDVSGGFSPSILTAVQHASFAAKVVAKEHCHSEHHHKSHGYAGHPLRIATLLYLATQGGADVCGLSSRIGSLEPGKAFDALVVSTRTDAGNAVLWGADIDAELGITALNDVDEHHGGHGRTEKKLLEGMLERFLFCGDDRNVRRVYVQGRFIGGKEFQG